MLNILLLIGAVVFSDQSADAHIGGISKAFSNRHIAVFMLAFTVFHDPVAILISAQIEVNTVLNGHVTIFQ